jgi:hypothetical protein
MKPQAAAALTLASAVLAATACSRSAEPTTRVAEPPRAPPPTTASVESTSSAPAPPPPASASSSTPPPPSAPDPSWTDESVLAELTRDCAYQPPDHDAANPSELSCKSGLFGQSCVADPCFDEDQKDCKPGCEKACNGCARECTKTCQACKRPCKDVDCERACAVTCGRCRQACLSAKDRCSTGTCGQAYSACSKRIQAQWKHSGCEKACPAYNACFEECNRSSSDTAPCYERCRKPLLRACPAPLAGMCMFNGGGPADVPP